MKDKKSNGINMVSPFSIEAIARKGIDLEYTGDQLLAYVKREVTRCHPAAVTPAGIIWRIVARIPGSGVNPPKYT